MVDGTRGIRKFLAIPPLPAVVTNPSLPVNPNPGCCNDCTLMMLADNTGSELTNDVFTVIWWFGITTTAATITMSKFINGTWSVVKTISDNTYGEYGAFGYFTNEEGQKFISLQINWASILNDSETPLGPGSYKFTCNYTDSILGDSSIDSYEFCLFTYSPQMAEGTIRFEYIQSGTFADINNRTLIKDFGTLQIYNNIRVKGYFGYPRGPYKSETVEDIYGHSTYVEDRLEEELECETELVPWWIHKILRVDFMMADSYAITDYNSTNADSYISVGLIKNSEYSPDHFPLQNIKSPVKLKFKPADNRTRRFKPNQ